MFIKAHNRALAEVQAHTQLKGDELFREARRVCRWHYQYLVINDFLKRMVGEPMLRAVLNARDGGYPTYDLRFYDPKARTFMPVEFSVAAYRFGHSLVRPSYRPKQGVEPIALFQQDAANDLRGFRALRLDAEIDWRMFFDEIDGSDFQLARRLDHKLSAPLSELPFAADDPSLASRNLKRSCSLKLPSGQSVAAAMCVDRLTAEELRLDELNLGDNDKNVLLHNTPLWFHILREADSVGEGQRLGPVGGRIVAEVFIGIMREDPLSYLHVDPCWSPAEERSMSDRIHPEKFGFKMGHFVKWATTSP